MNVLKLRIIKTLETITRFTYVYPIIIIIAIVAVFIVPSIFHVASFTLDGSEPGWYETFVGVPSLTILIVGGPILLALTIIGLVYGIYQLLHTKR